MHVQPHIPKRSQTWPPAHVDNQIKFNSTTTHNNDFMVNDGDLPTLLTPHALHPHCTTHSIHSSKCAACTTPECNPCPMQSFPHKRRNQCHTPMKAPQNDTHQWQQTDTMTDPHLTIMANTSKAQSKYTKQFVGLVLPCSPALAHPTTPMLLDFATNSCAAAIEMHWTRDMTEAAIAHGAHPLALQPELAAQL